MGAGLFLAACCSAIQILAASANAPSGVDIGDRELAATWTAAEQHQRSPSRLHVVTFMNQLHKHFAYLQVSAQAHSLHPQVIGYGLDAWWPDGLGVKINALRDFVYNSAVADNDVLLFADAFDVLVFGNEQEILSRFSELEAKSNRSIFLNAEEYCFPRIGDLCDESRYPHSPHWRHRYLNSGLIIGRGHALRKFLPNRVPDVIRGSDQAWYQQRFRDGAEIVLDTNCHLLCAITGDGEEQGVALRDGRISILHTGTTPPLVHFVSVAHWPTWRGGEATTALHETFRKLFPEEAARLLDPWRIDIQMGPTHNIKVYQGTGSWRLMRGVLCIKCRVLGSAENECIYFPFLISMQCWLPALLVFTLVLAAPLLLLSVVRRAHGRKVSDALALPGLPPLHRWHSALHFWHKVTKHKRRPEYIV